MTGHKGRKNSNIACIRVVRTNGLTRQRRVERTAITMTRRRRNKGFVK